jgi:phage terminase small subunit
MLSVTLCNDGGDSAISTIYVYQTILELKRGNMKILTPPRYKIMTKTKTKKPPAHLTATGKKLWNEHRGDVLDYVTLEVYCCAYERLLSAREDIAKRGLSIEVTSDRGHLSERPNPAVKIEAESCRIVLACQKKLNLIEEPPNPFDEFMQ